MADVTFIVRSNWLDYIADMPLEMRDKILAEIVRYGTEQPLEYSDDPVISSFLNTLKGNINYSKDRYKKSLLGGRPSKISDEVIIQGIKEGKTATAIAKEVGCDPSTITKREIWKKRKEIQNGSFNI